MPQWIVWKKRWRNIQGEYPECILSVVEGFLGRALEAMVIIVVSLTCTAYH
jgi:hypothetical protein